MATRSDLPVLAIRAIALLVSLSWVTGCQQGRPVSSRRLIEHQAMIDFSGLKPAERIENIRTTISAPRRWDLLPLKSAPFYTHQQWRSPSTHTGVGIAFVHAPFPLSTKLLVWLAKQEYAKRAGDGKVLGEWTDSLGRYWFEGENEKYHIRGYVVAQGFSAWIVYVGYRVKYPPDLAEISLAARSLETAVPLLTDAPPATQPTGPADAYR